MFKVLLKSFIPRVTAYFSHVCVCMCICVKDQILYLHDYIRNMTCLTAENIPVCRMGETAQQIFNIGTHILFLATS